MKDSATPLPPGEYLDWMHVPLRKLDEDASEASYVFTCGKYMEVEGGRAESLGSVSGRLRIRKSDGQVTLVEAAPGDDERRVASRAAQALKRHWAKGEYPEITAHVAG
jgi:hypothetical protein